MINITLYLVIYVYLLVKSQFGKYNFWWGRWNGSIMTLVFGLRIWLYSFLSFLKSFKSHKFQTNKNLVWTILLFSVFQISMTQLVVLQFFSLQHNVSPLPRRSITLSCALSHLTSFPLNYAFAYNNAYLLYLYYIHIILTNKIIIHFELAKITQIASRGSRKFPSSIFPFLNS